MAPNKRLKPNNIDIPLDIIFNILLKLRVKSLCRFKVTSKDWLALINNVLKVLNGPRKLIVPSLFKSCPRSFYTLDSQSSNEFVEIQGFSDHNLRIVGSCNGLLLVRSLVYTCGLEITYFLWNPLTGKCRKIPSPDSYKKSLVIDGLSYDSATNEFKLVMGLTAIIQSHESYSYHYHYPQIYNDQAYYVFSTSNSASSSRSWNRVGSFSYGTHLNNQAVVLNGSPHWILTRESVADAIVYFDPHYETFVELPIPDRGSSLKNCKLTVLGENLCCVDYIWYCYDKDLEIWVLKESSWSKLFAMPRSLPWGSFIHVFMPLYTIDDGKEESLALALDNQQKKISDRQPGLPRCSYLNEAIYYVETLASP